MKINISAVWWAGLFRMCSGTAACRCRAAAPRFDGLQGLLIVHARARARPSAYACTVDVIAGHAVFGLDGG